MFVVHIMSANNYAGTLRRWRHVPNEQSALDSGNCEGLLEPELIVREDV